MTFFEKEQCLVEAVSKLTYCQAFLGGILKKTQVQKNSGFREKTQIFSPKNPVFRNFEINLLNKLRKNSAQTPKNSGQMAKNSAFGIFLNFEIFEKVPRKSLK